MVFDSDWITDRAVPFLVLAFLVKVLNLESMTVLLWLSAVPWQDASIDWVSVRKLTMKVRDEGVTAIQSLERLERLTKHWTL